MRIILLIILLNLTNKTFSQNLHNLSICDTLEQIVKKKNTLLRNLDITKHKIKQFNFYISETQYCLNDSKKIKTEIREYCRGWINRVDIGSNKKLMSFEKKPVLLSITTNYYDSLENISISVIKSFEGASRFDMPCEGCTMIDVYDSPRIKYCIPTSRNGKKLTSGVNINCGSSEKWIEKWNIKTTNEEIGQEYKPIIISEEEAKSLIFCH